ncbi:hypothetical protein [Nitrospira sp. Nam80]
MKTLEELIKEPPPHLRRVEVHAIDFPSITMAKVQLGDYERVAERLREIDRH